MRKLACTVLLQITVIQLVRMQFSKQHISNADHLLLEPDQLVLHQLYRIDVKSALLGNDKGDCFNVPVSN